MRKRIIAIILTLALIIPLAMPLPVFAVKKTKAKINPKSDVAFVGELITINLSNNKKKVKWSVSNKKAKLVFKSKKEAVIACKKTGKVTITAKVGKKKYKCKLTIKKPIISVKCWNAGGLISGIYDYYELKVTNLSDSDIYFFSKGEVTDELESKGTEGAYLPEGQVSGIIYDVIIIKPGRTVSVDYRIQNGGMYQEMEYSVFFYQNGTYYRCRGDCINNPTRVTKDTYMYKEYPYANRSLGFSYYTAN